jgi:electron-transferring-flavoprotein dehydrogenase
MDVDVVVVGAGPAGLAAAIRLKQLNDALSVCVVEKGSEVGSHILSGNVFEPRALDELLPGWKEMDGADEIFNTPVTNDSMLFLTESAAIPLPHPPSLSNEGNYVISLGLLCRWLGEHAESMGVDIYPGFAASELLYDANNGAGDVCIGVVTGDVGIGKDGRPTDNFARGMQLRARQTLLAEGCRGSLAEDAMAKHALRDGVEPQTYGIGIKEVWEVSSDKVDDGSFQPGHVQHTIGWPHANDTYAGTFLYSMAPNKVLVGMVTGLDYANPYTNPYMAFQRRGCDCSYCCCLLCTLLCARTSHTQCATSLYTLQSGSTTRRWRRCSKVAPASATARVH